MIVLAAEVTPLFAVSESVAALHGLVAWTIGILGIPGHALIIRGQVSGDVMADED